MSDRGIAIPVIRLLEDVVGEGIARQGHRQDAGLEPRVQVNRERDIGAGEEEGHRDVNPRLW